MEIQERIKNRRLDLGMSIRELADKLNVSPSTILRYETAYIHNMGIDKVEILAKALQCTPAYLMGWEDPVVTALLPAEADALRSFRQLDSQDQGRALGYMERLLEEPKYQRKAGGAV